MKALYGLLSLAGVAMLATCILTVLNPWFWIGMAVLFVYWIF